MTDLIAAGVATTPHPIRWAVHAPHGVILQLTTIWQPVAAGHITPYRIGAWATLIVVLDRIRADDRVDIDIEGLT